MRTPAEASAFPFPLAADSSHHSHYHRFLLGADPSLLAPFPNPYCIGALSGTLPELTSCLDLPKWRKLYHGAFPWVEGFGPEHYRVGQVPPHRPLPRAYGRPPRKFGAYDFVQAADPSLSALALVAGDRRVIERFLLLCNDFCLRIEPGVSAGSPGPEGARRTGRMLAGQFAEPNNRWLMPFLHVHGRVLNFTAFEEAPARLACLDHAALARAGERARDQWVARQSEALADLGYRAALRGADAPRLCVDGVTDRLVAAMEAPRIAVLRMLERIVLGDRGPSAEELREELPAPVIAAMAEQLESLVARSLSIFKPPKIGIPSEGPWRGAVRRHLSQSCPRDLAHLDEAAASARREPYEAPLFCAPQLDAAHCHAPAIEAFTAADQQPCDPELGAGCAEPGPAASAWLSQEFSRTLREVNDRLVQVGPDDPLVALRGVLLTIDQLADGAGPDQLGESARFLGLELDRLSRQHEAADRRPPPGGRWDRVPLASLDELFEGAAVAPLACERELGGRSL